MQSNHTTSCAFYCGLVYRGHTIRMKRWLPEIEQKIKYAFNVIKNENETVQYLLNLGLTTHEIDLVLQHFLSNAEYNMKKQEQYQQMEMPARNPLSAQEQQLELIGFSQSVCRHTFRINCTFNSKHLRLILLIWIFVMRIEFCVCLIIILFFLFRFSFTCSIKKCIRICDEIRRESMLIALKICHRATNDRRDSLCYQRY